jgi:acyl-CoA reductase-like NAD-dependent aldehyde dehydrogenase
LFDRPRTEIIRNGCHRPQGERPATGTFRARPETTAAIVTSDLAKAMETAERVEAGYVWINSNGRYIGAPYGGWKQSGIGEEECFDEIVSYTQVKSINMIW